MPDDAPMFPKSPPEVPVDPPEVEPKRPPPDAPVEAGVPKENVLLFDIVNGVMNLSRGQFLIKSGN